MPPPRSPEVDAYSAAVEDVRSRVVAYGLAAWAATAIDDAGAARLAAQMAAVVAAAQLRVAYLTAVFLARQTGTDPAPVVESRVTGLRRGVDPLQVYERPVIKTRAVLAQQIARGQVVDLDAARAQGENRLESLLTTDLQLAKREQAHLSLMVAERKYYRRVPRASGACALCLIASTQKYKVGNLAPLHPGCQCTFEALEPGADLDRDFNADQLLEATHAKVKEFTGIADRGGRAPDYRKLLITREHGELGEIIAYRNYKFTAKKDIPRPAAAVVA